MFSTPFARSIEIAAMPSPPQPSTTTQSRAASSGSFEMPL
jgi:hypothetical protein